MKTRGQDKPENMHSTTEREQVKHKGYFHMGQTSLR